MSRKLATVLAAVAAFVIVAGVAVASRPQARHYKTQSCFWTLRITDHVNGDRDSTAYLGNLRHYQRTCIKGIRGARGPRGFTVQGPQGLIGPVGPPGAPGRDGQDGSNGLGQHIGYACVSGAQSDHVMHWGGYDPNHLTCTVGQGGDFVQPIVTP